MLTEERYGLNFKHCPKMHFSYHFKDIFNSDFFGATACCPIKNKKTMFLKIHNYLDFFFNNQIIYE